MRKKKLLFVIPSLGAGGAEKSLVNLLNVIDPERYEVDLFLFSTTGLFLPQLPDFVKVLPKPKRMTTFQLPLLESVLQFISKGKLSMIWNRVMFAMVQRWHSNKAKAEQCSWKFLSKAVKPLTREYDAGIGFLEKSSIYFVVDFVNAKSKIGFIHNDYTQLHLDPKFDALYFRRLNYIATVSKECVESLTNVFPEYRSKVKLVHNIVSAKLIDSLAQEFEPVLEANAIVSVGRLHPQKGFDMAVQAAAILKKKNINFHWYILGEGPERQNLESLIEKHRLQNHFSLFGLKENPYPYIRQAKVFVQCSRYEGKSIAIDEAKILAKPILLTDFTTAKDQIENEVNGLIVEMNSGAIAEGILKYFQNQSFKESVTLKLTTENFGTEREIEKFYELI